MPEPLPQLSQEYDEKYNEEGDHGEDGDEDEALLPADGDVERLRLLHVLLRSV